MLEEQCNIFDKITDGYIGILTNGIIKANGCLVMGAGQAKEVLDLYPGIDLIIGRHFKFKDKGPRVVFFAYMDVFFFTFPTKHHYAEKSDLNLIFKSAQILQQIAIGNQETRYYLPRPGCGLGGLKWDEVKSVISFLPNNVIIVNR